MPGQTADILSEYQLRSDTTEEHLPWVGRGLAWDVRLSSDRRALAGATRAAAMGRTRLLALLEGAVTEVEEVTPDARGGVREPMGVSDQASPEARANPDSRETPPVAITSPTELVLCSPVSVDVPQASPRAKVLANALVVLGALLLLAALISGPIL